MECWCRVSSLFVLRVFFLYRSQEETRSIHISSVSVCLFLDMSRFASKFLTFDRERAERHHDGGEPCMEAAGCPLRRTPSATAGSECAREAAEMTSRCGKAGQPNKCGAIGANGRRTSRCGDSRMRRLNRRIVLSNPRGSDDAAALIPSRAARSPSIHHAGCRADWLAGRPCAACCASMRAGEDWQGVGLHVRVISPACPEPRRSARLGLHGGTLPACLLALLHRARAAPVLAGCGFACWRRCSGCALSFTPRFVHSPRPRLGQPE